MHVVFIHKVNRLKNYNIIIKQKMKYLTMTEKKVMQPGND